MKCDTCIHKIYGENAVYCTRGHWSDHPSQEIAINPDPWGDCEDYDSILPTYAKLVAEFLFKDLSDTYLKCRLGLTPGQIQHDLKEKIESCFVQQFSINKTVENLKKDYYTKLYSDVIKSSIERNR